MKPSFYFVALSLIYPLLGMLNMPFLNKYPIIVGAVLIIGLSWWISKMFPDILLYERGLDMAPLMENVYTGNVEAFVKRLRRDVHEETVAAAYLLISTGGIAYIMFKQETNSWVTLIVLGLISFWSVSHLLKVSRALWAVRENPTPEECAEQIVEIYSVNYELFYKERETSSWQDMLQQAPAHFRGFQIFAMIVAGICALMGLGDLVWMAIKFIAAPAVDFVAAMTMQALFGTLAIFFGCRDFVAFYRSLKIADALAKPAA